MCRHCHSLSHSAYWVTWIGRRGAYMEKTYKSHRRERFRPFRCSPWFIFWAVSCCWELWFSVRSLSSRHSPPALITHTLVNQWSGANRQLWIYSPLRKLNYTLDLFNLFHNLFILTRRERESDTCPLVILAILMDPVMEVFLTEDHACLTHYTLRC